MKRVLILSPFFYPEPISTGRYNLSLAQALVKDGAAVTVVCLHPTFPSWKPQISNAQLPGMKIIRGGGALRFPGSTVSRHAVLEIWFLGFALAQCWRLRKQLDLVVAAFPPSLFFLGVSAVLPRSVRRVGLIHDLQGVHARASGSRLARALVGVIGWVERRAFNGCHRLVALSEAMGRQLHEQMGVDPARVTVVYPFVNLPEPDTRAENLADLFPPGFVHVVYSGGLGDKQNPDGLAAIIEALVNFLPYVQVHVFSEGPLFERLRVRLANSAVSRVSLRGLVADEDLAELYSRADIQVIPQAAGTQHGSMPSKLPNILASGKKVLAICDADSELAEMVKLFGAGLAIESWEPRAACEAVALLAADVRNSAGLSPDLGRVRKFFSIDRLISAVMGDDAVDT